MNREKIIVYIINFIKRQMKKISLFRHKKNQLR